MVDMYPQWLICEPIMNKECMALETLTESWELDINFKKSVDHEYEVNGLGTHAKLICTHHDLCVDQIW